MWPTTLGAGAAGAALVVGGMYVTGFAPTTTQALALLGLGLAHGLVAPFVIPIQHRRPILVAILATLLVVAGWIGLMILVVALEALAAAGVLYRYGPPSDVLGWLFVAYMGVMVSCAAITSSSLADAFVGPRSWIATQFGESDLRRLGVTGTIAITIWAAAFMIDARQLLGGASLLSSALMGLMSTVCGLPALEHSKVKYLDALPPGRR